MIGFNNKNGELHIDEVPLSHIAEQYGTPSYVYSASHIRRQYNALKQAMAEALPKDNQPMLCYACKANSNVAILALLKSLGSSLEIVSEGELFRGLKAGFKGEEIISTSFGKNETEIEACLNANLLQFNIESPEELQTINRCASRQNKRADVVFRLNPDIKGGGHKKISTGLKENKFGNTAEDIISLYEAAEQLEYINPVGVSIHIGSQIMQAEAFKPSFEKLAALTHTLREKGHEVTHLDIGGGFPIAYNNEQLLDLSAYAEWVRNIILPLDTKIQMEPGRYLVGNAGILLTRAQYIKTTPSKNFLVLDAGMNDLIRPTLYEAYHNIEAVKPRDTEQTYDVVGPICESGDIFASERTISTIEKDDLVAIKSAGAYGYSMASSYNSRPLPAEIMVDGDQIHEIGARQTLEQLITRETIPEYLTN